MCRPIRPVVHEPHRESMPRKSVSGPEITTGTARGRKRSSHTTTTASPHNCGPINHNVASKMEPETRTVGVKMSREQALLEHVLQLTDGANRAESHCAATPNAPARSEGEVMADSFRNLPSDAHAARTNASDAVCRTSSAFVGRGKQ
jgi:hypothetical protein